MAGRSESYACKSKNTITLHEYKNNTETSEAIDHVTMELWETHIQAFDLPSSGKFSQGQSVSQSSYSNFLNYIIMSEFWWYRGSDVTFYIVMPEYLKMTNYKQPTVTRS